MTPQAITPKSDEVGMENLDVWSRTSRRHRLRAVMMLLLLALLFAGLCCFAFWLRTGVYIPWQFDHYRELMRNSFVSSGSDQAVMSDFLVSPIPVREVPIFAVIMGLQFASLSSIPILVAILYRLPISVLFAAMVVFLAAMPWVGITVMIGCILATTGPFRFAFRYASALIGLVPVAIYFVLASWKHSGASSLMGDNQALLYAPWVLALLGSCVICAVALAIARLINFRPGGIPPLLITLFAVPVYLFHSQVGRDELEYRLLEHEIGPGRSSLFVPVDLGQWAKRETMRRWSEGTPRTYDEIYWRILHSLESRILLLAERNRYRAIEDCDAFCKNYPHSRYIPNVLYFKAMTQDLRIYQAKLRKDHRAEFRSDFPHRASRASWQLLYETSPESLPGAVAMYNLALLTARDGELDSAIALLEKMINRFDIAKAATQPAAAGKTVVGSVFLRSPASSGLGIDLETLILQASRLKEMLLACRKDPPLPLSKLFGPRQDGSDMPVYPVQVLLWFDQSDPHYKSNLLGLAWAFPHSETAGYIEIRLALLEPAISRRIRRFQNAAERLKDHPAGAEALFYLGDARQEDSLLDEAKTTFESLVQHYPNSSRAREAKHRLTSLSILQEAAQ